MKHTRAVRRRAPLSFFMVLAAALVLFAGHCAGLELPRHPLEIKALVQPTVVIEELPKALREAELSGDVRTQALLHLAHANACRVIADWRCQRQQGAFATALADRSAEPIIAIRGVIADSRGAIAMLDYTRGEQLLGNAEARLKASPSPELSADVFLAYSSLSYSIGKHVLAKTYAERGLQALGQELAAPIRARLLRNKARAEALLGNVDQAQQTLNLGIASADQTFDPKLSAEMHIEAARIARQLGNVPEQRRNAQRILDFAKKLNNVQLLGLGHEVMGLSALSEGDLERANSELSESLAAFRTLKLKRDELRVSRELIDLKLEVQGEQTELARLVSAYLTLEREVVDADRAQASDDFDARVKYAQVEVNLARLEAQAALGRERETASAQRAQLRGLVALLAFIAIAVLAVFFVVQWRLNRRLTEAMAQQRASESRALGLLEITDGFVFLHDLQGALLMVNPAVAAALGGSAATLVGRSLFDFVAHGARSDFESYLERVRATGRAEGNLSMRHGDRREHHWRYSARLSGSNAGSYVIANGVDITEQVEESSALREQSLRDVLTHAYNRRFLDLFESATSADACWGVIVVDLDRFKKVNDSLGHAEGDRILLETAELLRANTPRDGAVVRLGGDEFVLLLARCKPDELAALSDTLRAHNAHMRCRFSIGTALREGQENLQATLSRADANMYDTRNADRSTQGG